MAIVLVLVMRESNSASGLLRLQRSSVPGLTRGARQVVVPAPVTSLENHMLPSLMVFAVLALTVYGQLMIKARSLAHAAPIGDGANKLQYLISMFGDIGVLRPLFPALGPALLLMAPLERAEVGSPPSSLG